MTPRDTIEGLPTRVHRLEIRAELSDLVARYGHALDGRDWDGAVDCFARDGRLSLGATTTTGRAELKQLLATSLERFEFTFHYPHSQVFEVDDDDHARGLISAHAEHGLSGTCLLAGIRYDDEYVREDGRWRFARRVVDSRYLLPWPELGSTFHEGAIAT